MHIDRACAQRAFDAYVASYDAGNPRIALKVEHTARVADLCDAIAHDEGLGADDADLAWLCGLLHDIGRFEQLRRWDTFDDSRSASHAALGVGELFGTAEDAPGNIRRFVCDPSCEQIIRQAVGQHSALALDDGLDERTRMFCDIVRDADKVDILRVADESSVETILGIGPEQFLASGISEGALRAFSERRCVARAERTQPADFLVGLMCFVFELNFPASIRTVRDQGHLARICEDPFDLGKPFGTAATRATWQHLCAELKRYLSSAPAL